MHQDIQLHIAHRLRIGRPWPLFELFGERTAGSVAIVQNWLRPIVHEALVDKAAAARGDVDEEHTFLSHLASSTDGTPRVNREESVLTLPNLSQIPKQLPSRY